MFYAKIYVMGSNARKWESSSLFHFGPLYLPNPEANMSRHNRIWLNTKRIFMKHYLSLLCYRTSVWRIFTASEKTSFFHLWMPSNLILEHSIVLLPEVNMTNTVIAMKLINDVTFPITIDSEIISIQIKREK